MSQSTKQRGVVPIVVDFVYHNLGRFGGKVRRVSNDRTVLDEKLSDHSPYRAENDLFLIHYDLFCAAGVLGVRELWGSVLEAGDLEAQRITPPRAALDLQRGESVI